VRTNVRLLEVGEDFPIRIRGYAGKPRYKCVRELRLKRKRVEIPIKRLKEIVKGLQQKYPDKGYYLVRDRARHWLVDAEGEEKHMKMRTKWFWIIGRKEENRRGIPLYYSSTYQRLFVPSSFVNNKYRLVCSVLSYRLRDLGVSFSVGYA